MHQLRPQAHLIRYIVCNGIPPSSVDSTAFKNFISAIQPKYDPPSATTLRDRLIPNEAARLQISLFEKLGTSRNLTLSFDGGKTRRPHGIYTVTITTPGSRKSYLVDLNDASRVSHTARYIVQEVLKPVLNKIPPENVSAVVSDNTGNTRKGRELLAELFPHILNFQDCCHEMNLALLQINELSEFKEMIQDVKDILSFMHHSTYAMEHFNEARKALKISTGLTRVVATRFWTYVAAVDSIFQGLPAFSAIVEDPGLFIDIVSKNELFEKQSVHVREFEIKLVQYLAITTPFARAIKCLESASATASDVYAYWVAIMSRLEFVMSKSSRIKLRPQTMEDIRAIANQRFNELLEDGVMHQS
ncbi:hypothetical protein NUW54_g9257 [Trametes sanguinea]|uniref:Uncharacterized protein n=1 Tax=Trametes sanguinea TaxID=158606 RepID=A0ACC1PA33_9APHY|nr:hypothetical protein NUW54_g9257 [Trametes sanguinea]